MRTMFTAFVAIFSMFLLASLTAACSDPALEKYVVPDDTVPSSQERGNTELPLEEPLLTPTATIYLTSTPTLESTVEPTPTPDWESIAAQMAALPDSESWKESSPDGKWTAVGRTKTETGVILADQEQYYTQLKVLSAAQSVEWVLLEEISPFGLGYTTPEAVHWSPDGRYLYYTNRPHVDGCGLFVTGSDLWRAGLEDGTVSQILPTGAQSYAFSPDGSQVAYITWSTPPELVLHDLTTRAEHRVTLGFEDAGAMVWSPDSTTIAMTGAIKPCQPEWKQAIMLVNTNDLVQSTILPPDERLVKTTAWQEAGKILLEDMDRNLWWLQVESGEVTLIQ